MSLRAQAISMIEDFPERAMPDVISALEALRDGSDRIKFPNDPEKAKKACEFIRKHRRMGDVDRDYKKELSDILEEKYASIG